jgi:hypothetical protein
MAWDKTFPVPTTKIRDLSTGIPNNWDAIESADTSFTPDGLNLTKQGSDLSKLTDAIRIYSKDDSSGDTQLFAINDASSAVVNQLTGASYTETTNPGSAGGTLYKIVWPIDGTSRIVVYGGKSGAFSGSAVVTLPESYTTLYTGSATADDANVQKISFQTSTSSITLRTENSVEVRWFLIGRIA